MKTAFLTGIRELEIGEEPQPSIRQMDDVLVRIDVVGVCSSDVHWYTTGQIGSQVVQYPESTGQECAGTVVLIGPEVRHLKRGDRVAVDPAISCGRCDQCLNGRAHTCRHLRFLGCPGQAKGALSEYLVLPARCCHKLPDSMSQIEAALCEPLSIGMYAVMLAGMKPGAKAGILGSGPIGLSVLLACKAEDPSRRVYMTDLIDTRLLKARELGADWTAVPTRENVVLTIGAHEPLGLDYVFECAGEQETLDQAIDLLKPGGLLLMIGIPDAQRVSFPIDKFRRKEIRVQNVRRQNGCIKPVIENVAGGKIAPTPMVTHHFPLERTQEAFEMVAGYADGVIKAMIHVSAESQEKME